MNLEYNEKIPVIAVVGATASGKTAVAVETAKHFNGEVVSCDSMQIYKGMDIASAKPAIDEMQGIKHHLIDFLPYNEKYSVARYINDASVAIKDIRKRNKNAVLCGGTGLYIDSLLQNISFHDEPDNPEVRASLRKRREEEGIEVLFGELKSIDPETADSLHINNEGRVLRALETYILTGEKPSVLKKRSREKPSPYIPVYIGLDYSDRNILYDRINRRVDMMIEKGLVEEAKEYFKLDGTETCSQAIGHKEILPYLLGEISLEEAAENLKKATRHYAKRQMTWFRRNEKINTVYCDKYESFEELMNEIFRIIENSGYFKAGEVL